eukprot:TRINITY_DN3693_c0_g1_i2.p1 TRINITY_DN3693_c0_g1~~TRINITY_DN3693_c0_g1_i2.p1  ORF type:complete len:186 (-),score=27.62 TRINITY_DN3693_c0_g1_i2:59-616(-)
MYCLMWLEIGTLIMKLIYIEMFDRVKAFNIAVYQCRSPELQQYIGEFMESLHPWIYQGIAERVAIQINREDGTPHERFIFEIKQYEDECATIEKLHQSLGSFFVKLSVCSNQLIPIEGETSWEILLYTKQGNADDVWIDAPNVTMEEPSIVPLRSYNGGAVKMQLYVEKNTSSAGNMSMDISSGL